jgi:hypothetical protein
MLKMSVLRRFCVKKECTVARFASALKNEGNIHRRRRTGQKEPEQVTSD